MSDLHRLSLTFSEDEAENILRRGHINVLSFYLMSESIFDNFLIFNRAAVKLLKNPAIRGRRRTILEKFVGKVATYRMCGKIKMEEDLQWQD